MVNGGVMKQDIIGFCEYFATGEGMTYMLMSGTEEAIKDFAGPYFSIGLTFFSFEDMRKALIAGGSNDIDNPIVKAAEMLNGHLPTVAKLIQKYGYCEFTYKLHYNLA